MRKAVTLVLCLALQGAALTGWLVHAHPHGHATAHHDGRAVHAHWTGHARSHLPLEGPAIGPHDHDRAVFLNPYLAVATSATPVLEFACASAELAVPAERRSHRGIDVVRSHDPPIGRCDSSRAPPAFLS